MDSTHPSLTWLLDAGAHEARDRTEDRWVEPSFETPEVREICETREAAIAALGDAAASDLAARLSEALASTTFEDFKLLVDDQLDLQPDGTYTLILSTGWVVRGRAGGATVPTTSMGAVDWGGVNRMRIVSIELLA